MGSKPLLTLRFTDIYEIECIERETTKLNGNTMDGGYVADNENSAIIRAILASIPTALIALDSNDTVIVANIAASKLLKIPREQLIGGSLYRYLEINTRLTSTSQQINLSTPYGPIEVIAASKDLIVDDDQIRIVVLKAISSTSKSITDFVCEFSKSLNEPYQYVTEALVELSIAREVSIRLTTSSQCDVLASTTTNNEIFSTQPTIARTITKNDPSHLELVLIPNFTHGLTVDDLKVIDMFISLLQLSADNTESATDASGSETALAIALEAGDLGLCFMDTNRKDIYISDQLASWCSIDIETFSGRLDDWLNTFRAEDKTRFHKLIKELDQESMFKTVIHLDGENVDKRLELIGQPLHIGSTSEWVVIAKEFNDQQEVEAAWQTRIAMEETARVEAEESLENFEISLVSTLIPTTSDVAILHSRQDAGTWHIVRPLDSHSCIYAVGAVTASSRAEAVIEATITATIADVLATQSPRIEQFVEQLRDHARARDIETTIAAVLVVDNSISAATHGGASVFISGKPLVMDETITVSTALSLSSHSQATTETIDVAANGRPWRIMNVVIEVLNVIQTDQPQMKNHYGSDETHGEIEFEYEEDSNGSQALAPEEIDISKHENVSPFRSGSITPN